MLDKNKRVAVIPLIISQSETLFTEIQQNIDSCRFKDRVLFDRSSILQDSDVSDWIIELSNNIVKEIETK